VAVHKFESIFNIEPNTTEIEPPLVNQTQLDAEQQLQHIYECAIQSFYKQSQLQQLGGDPQNNHKDMAVANAFLNTALGAVKEKISSNKVSSSNVVNNNLIIDRNELLDMIQKG
jgi:hypothetical protein